jgi:hypothetical protein
MKRIKVNKTDSNDKLVIIKNNIVYKIKRKNNFEVFLLKFILNKLSFELDIPFIYDVKIFFNTISYKYKFIN